MTLVVKAFALISILVLSACSSDDAHDQESEDEIKVYSGQIYGTTYSIKIADVHPKKINAMIVDELNRIDYVFSTYKQSSLISKLNRNEKVETTEEFDYVLDLAMSISNLTGGAFNPYDKNGLDFSGIAKGYAIDKIGELFERNSIYNYFIEIGGEIKAVGSKHRENWVFAIESPTNTKKTPYIAFKVPQSGISLATSGEYRESDHIWGSGPRDIISITVISNNVASADAWATAMYVMGKDKALAIAEEYEIPIFLIDDSGTSIQSTRWSMIPL